MTETPKTTIAGMSLELFDAGSGPPLLFLHGAQGFFPTMPHVGMLAASRRLIAPSHPGFGGSDLPDWLDSVADIAIIYLELLDQLDLRRIDVIGCSLGGWIAAEMASMDPARFRRMVLAGPVGVKLGPADRLDIPDIFAMPQDRVTSLLYHDPARMRVPDADRTDAELAILARNRETTALLAWEPWFHNPKLPHRLHRARMPVLFLRGESDGLVSRDYMDGYARLFANARVQTIAEAGHAPHVEQPERFMRAVDGFLGHAGDGG